MSVVVVVARKWSGFSLVVVVVVSVPFFLCGNWCIHQHHQQLQQQLFSSMPIDGAVGTVADEEIAKTFRIIRGSNAVSCEMIF
jgi:hypothetical protein